MATSPIAHTESFLSHKRIKFQTMAWFLKRLAKLLADGFSMKEAMTFLKTLNAKEEHWIESILTGLEAGYSLEQELSKAGFPEQIVTQIYFASAHGKLHETLLQCGISLEEKEKRRKKMWQLSAYPSMLILFMTGLLLSMRSVLLPHLNTEKLEATEGFEWVAITASSFVKFFPQILLVFLFFCCFVYVILRWHWRNQSAWRTVQSFVAFPLIGKVVRLYYTQWFSQEWGRQFDSNLELLEVVQLMQGENATRLTKEIGSYLESELKKGKSFPDSLSKVGFLNQEMIRIIRHGEQTGHLGKELLVYSEDCLEETEAVIERMMTLIQPISFLLVGFLIISVYGALLLPMLSNMEGIL